MKFDSINRRQGNKSVLYTTTLNLGQWLGVDLNVGTSGTFGVCFAARNIACQANLASFWSFNVAGGMRGFLFNSGTTPNFNGQLRLLNPTLSVTLSNTPHNGYSVYCILFNGTTKQILCYVDGTLRGTLNYTGNNVTGTGRMRFFMKDVATVDTTPEGDGGILAVFSDITGFRNYEGFIAWEYGIVNKLDGAHPFKTTPPMKP